MCNFKRPLLTGLPWGYDELHLYPRHGTQRTLSQYRYRGPRLPPWIYTDQRAMKGEAEGQRPTFVVFIQVDSRASYAQKQQWDYR